MRVLGETSTIQKDTGHLTETKNASNAISTRGRDEGRGRVRQVLETIHFDDSRTMDERSLDDQSVERDQERSIARQVFGEERWIDVGEPPDVLAEEADTYEVDANVDDRWHTRDLRDGKTKLVDLDENGRDDSSRRRSNRGWAKSRGKGRTNEGVVENDQALTSPGSGSRLGVGRSFRDRNSLKNSDVKKVSDARKHLGRNTDVSFVEREDNDDCFQDCRVGTKDISDLVKKAVRAAEAEARAANAPAEAIKAAGDAAAEVVKSAAQEVDSLSLTLSFCFCVDVFLCDECEFYLILYISNVYYNVCRNSKPQTMKKLQYWLLLERPVLL